MTEPSNILATIDYEGTRLPVTNLFDIDGDPVEDFKLATSGVAQLPDGKWLAFSIDLDTLARLRELQ